MSYTAIVGLRFASYANQLPKSATLVWQPLCSGRRRDRPFQAYTDRIASNTS